MQFSAGMDLTTLNYTSDTVTKEILKYMNSSFIGITVSHAVLMILYLWAFNYYVPII